MEQTNAVLSSFQAMAAQNLVPKTGKNDKAADDFQKLLDQKAQPAKSGPSAAEKSQTGDVSAKADKAPAQEDSLEQVKKLAEQGYAVVQSGVGTVSFDPNSVTLGKSETGEYVVMQLGEDGEVLSVIELDPWQQQQLQQFMHSMELMDQAKDPEADAMLKATDPSAEHKLTDLLEKAVDEQAGQAMEQVVEGAKSQDEDDRVELTDADQGPQRLFHDVKAAPVKVGDVEVPQQAEEVNVAGQIDAQLAQALQNGDTMVRIQLNPEHLGQVTVEITQNTDGALRVALTAHNDSTRGLLERHAGDLQGMLAGRTNQSVEVSVQRQAESQQNQNQQHSYDGHNGHAQQEQERRRQREHTSPEDFMQQLRLGLIPDDGGI